MSLVVRPLTPSSIACVSVLSYPAVETPNAAHSAATSRNIAWVSENVTLKTHSIGGMCTHLRLVILLRWLLMAHHGQMSTPHQTASSPHANALVEGAIVQMESPHFCQWHESRAIWLASRTFVAKAVPVEEVTPRGAQIGGEKETTHYLKDKLVCVGVCHFKPVGSGGPADCCILEPKELDVCLICMSTSRLTGIPQVDTIRMLRAVKTQESNRDCSCAGAKTEGPLVSKDTSSQIGFADRDCQILRESDIYPHDFSVFPPPKSELFLHNSYVIYGFRATTTRLC